MERNASSSVCCDGRDQLSTPVVPEPKSRESLLLLQHDGAGYALQVFADLKQFPNAAIN